MTRKDNYEDSDLDNSGSTAIAVEHWQCQREKYKANVNNRDGVTAVWCAMGVSLLEQRRNEEILEEAKVEPMTLVTRRRRIEWFGHMKRNQATENMRAVADGESSLEEGPAQVEMDGLCYEERESIEGERGIADWQVKMESATLATPYSEMPVNGQNYIILSG